MAASAGYVRGSFVMASLDQFSEFEHLERILLDAVCDEPIDYSEESLEGSAGEILQIPERALFTGTSLPAREIKEAHSGRKPLCAYFHLAEMPGTMNLYPCPQTVSMIPAPSLRRSL